VFLVVTSFWLSFNLGSILFKPAVKELTQISDWGVPLVKQPQIDTVQTAQTWVKTDLKPKIKIRTIKKETVTAKKPPLASNKNSKSPEEKDNDAVVEEKSIIIQENNAINNQNEQVKKRQNIFYKVETGIFSTQNEAEQMVSSLKELGFPSFMEFGNNNFKVQVGAFRDKNKAENLRKDLENRGFQSEVVEEEK
jgi:cell division protein FtsN